MTRFAGWSWPVRAVREAISVGGRFLGRTGCDHALPDFLVVGAMKAGSTSFFGALVGHPHILPPLRKEIHFFSSNRYRRGTGWYRRRFPLGLELRDGRLTGEGSPTYLSEPRAPARIRAVVPRARLIAVLRDPVHRAISQYFHMHRRGREPLPPAEAFAREEERLAGDLRRMEQDEWYEGVGFQYYSYKYRGHYADQLERFLTHFPASQVLILSSDAFFAQPGEVLARAYAFLGLDPALGPAQPRRRNRGRRPQDDVPDRVYDDLARYFAPHNERLYRLVGADWGWRRPGEPASLPS